PTCSASGIAARSMSPFDCAAFAAATARKRQQLQTRVPVEQNIPHPLGLPSQMPPSNFVPGGQAQPEGAQMPPPDGQVVGQFPGAFPAAAAIATVVAAPANPTASPEVTTEGTTLISEVVAGTTAYVRPASLAAPGAFSDTSS